MSGEPGSQDVERAAGAIRGAERERAALPFLEWILKLFGFHDMAARLKRARERAAQRSDEDLRSGHGSSQHSRSNSDAQHNPATENTDHDRRSAHEEQEIRDNDSQGDSFGSASTRSTGGRTGRGFHLKRLKPAHLAPKRPGHAESSAAGAARPRSHFSLSIRSGQTSHSGDTQFFSIRSSDSEGSHHHDPDCTDQQNADFQDQYRRSLDRLEKKDPEQRLRALELDGTKAAVERRGKSPQVATSSDEAPAEKVKASSSRASGHVASARSSSEN
ncbi:MAG: hypothetical protein Q9162_002789 [Coniocarpon cinnabarinum]